MSLGQQGLLAGHGNGGQQPLAGFDGTRHEQQKNHAQEEIGGQAQQLGARTDAPQVGQHHQEHRQQAKRHPLGLQAREIGGEGGNARRRTHCHREHVIDRQGCTCDQARQGADVLLGNPIGAAAVGVGLDGLAIAGADDQHQQHDQTGDRQGETEGGGPRHAQDQNDLLGGIGHGGEGVGTENRQGFGIAVALFVAGAGRQGTANDRSTQPVKNCLVLHEAGRCRKRVDANLYLAPLKASFFCLRLRRSANNLS